MIDGIETVISDEAGDIVVSRCAGSLDGHADGSGQGKVILTSAQTGYGSDILLDSCAIL